MSYQSVLVGTDGSDSSYRAVDRAAELARDSSARLLIACAYRPMGGRQREQVGDALGDLAYKVAGSHPAEDILIDARARAERLGVTNVVTEAVEGDPVDALIGLADSRAADVIVVGNAGSTASRAACWGRYPRTSPTGHRSTC